MRKISILLAALCAINLYAQDDELLELLESETAKDKGYVSATFKGTRVVNGHSVETRTNGVLEFIIAHRFGALNEGYRELYGLDIANMRIGLEYGITDNLNIGIGRSTVGKVLESFLKYRVIRQNRSTPLTATFFTSIARQTLDSDEISSLERNAYTAQLLLARKFNSSISIQLMPTIIQRNLVPTNDDDNLLISVGIGGRYKLTNRLALVAEYYPQLSDKSDVFQDSFAVGFDIETGGHVFQLHFTNAEQMNERGFIGETTDDFWSGDVRYGFNITRAFDLRPHKK